MKRTKLFDGRCFTCYYGKKDHQFARCQSIKCGCGCWNQIHEFPINMLPLEMSELFPPYIRVLPLREVVPTWKNEKKVLFCSRCKQKKLRELFPSGNNLSWCRACKSEVNKQCQLRRKQHES